MYNKVKIKIGFLSSVSAYYALTLLLLWQAFLVLNPRYTPVVNAQTIDPKKTELILKKLDIKKGTPAELLVPSLNIDKKILPGIYDADTKTWPVSDEGVHYANLSVIANDYGGNTLIYGHNNDFTFGPLFKLQKGDIAEIITDNNLKFTYKFERSIEYKPTDTSVFDFNGPPQLSLQTCRGWLNQIRTLYQFSFVKVVKYEF